MKKIIILALTSLLMTSCAAQYHGHHRHGRPHRHSSGAAVGAAVVTGVVIGGIILSERDYQRSNRYEPNQWHRRVSFWPSQISNQPYWYYPTREGNILYTSSANFNIGVEVAGSVLVIENQGKLYVYVNRRCMFAQTLSRGINFEVSLTNGETVEVYRDGPTRIVHRDRQGHVIENFEL